MTYLLVYTVDFTDPNRDASSLSKQAARLTMKCLGCEKLQREISFAMELTSQMPECQA